jgi:hypothetical protein
LCVILIVERSRLAEELTPFILSVSLIVEWSRLAEELTPFVLCVSLIAERTRLAASVSLPAYMVVSEQSLLQLAEMRPTLPASLARIQVGQKPQCSRFCEVLSPKSIYFWLNFKVVYHYATLFIFF